MIERHAGEMCADDGDAHHGVSRRVAPDGSRLRQRKLLCTGTSPAGPVQAVAEFAQQRFAVRRRNQRNAVWQTIFAHAGRHGNRSEIEQVDDIELAIDNLRKSGQAKAAKKAGNIAADGAITIVQDGNKAALVEVNCQTDFVAKDENFSNFSNAVAKAILASGVTEAEKIAVKRRYNIMDDKQFPDLTRFDPVALALGIRPGQVCQIDRPSKTAISAPYYRICN